MVRTQRELDRAAHKGLKPGKTRTASLGADDDTIGRKDKEITGVFVVRDNVARFVPVRSGLASETMIEVSGDVKEGDQVVAGPYKALRELKPGGKVRKDSGGVEGQEVRPRC